MPSVNASTASLLLVAAMIRSAFGYRGRGEPDVSPASPHAEGVIFATGTGRRLAYGRLAALDSHGHALPARFELPEAMRLRLVVEDGDGDGLIDFDGGQSICGACTGQPRGCPANVSDLECGRVSPGSVLVPVPRGTASAPPTV